MTNKEKIAHFDNEIYEKIIAIYNLVEKSDYTRFLGNIHFTKIPKKDYYSQRYVMYIKISTDINDFIVADKKYNINLHEKESSLKVLTTSLNSTAKYFEYSDTIETALGIYQGKHISIVFEKAKSPK